MTWQNRILGQQSVAVADLIENPDNWRNHSPAQLAALKAILTRHGEAKPIIVRHPHNRIIDGHARVALAKKNGQATITAVLVDLTDDQANLALAILDPLGQLAVTDADQWHRLRADVITDDPDADALLSYLCSSAMLTTTPEQPAGESSGSEQYPESHERMTSLTFAYSADEYHDVMKYLHMIKHNTGAKTNEEAIIWALERVV